MKQYTKEDLETIVDKVMNPDNSKYLWQKFDIEIIKQTDKELLFEASHMYDWSDWKVSFQQLREFAKEFGTDDIDMYEEIRESGCETCDYGSRYGFALRIWE